MGASRGSPGIAAGGGILRDSSAATLGYFTINLVVSYSFDAELHAVMTVIELAYRKGWIKLCLECESMLVINSFKDPKMVPWQMRIRWLNYVQLTRQMFFFSPVMHVYREGNSCADKLAAHGLVIQDFIWWDTILDLVRADFVRNRLLLSFYRFFWFSFHR